MLGRDLEFSNCVARGEGRVGATESGEPGEEPGDWD